MIDLSIFIVNYNGAKFISQCLESVFASEVQFTYEVIVVDNHSTDSSLSLLKQYGAQIYLIDNSENQSCNLLLFPHYSFDFSQLKTIKYNKIILLAFYGYGGYLFKEYKDVGGHKVWVMLKTYLMRS